ncbi:MAG: hydroxyacylglutathione hydrolase [Pseudomonadota bacterium]
MVNLEFHQFPCLSDNYCVLVHDPVSGDTAAIDAPETDAVRKAISEKGWTLTHILVTHHHFDHTQGISDLKASTGCHVIGPLAEASKITTLDETVSDGDHLTFGGEAVKVISTPGHTLGMVNYHFTESHVIFTGDTLFSMGCGRVFEGDMQMMWDSMCKLKGLPRNTIIYCGHEYTKSNAEFALTIDPDNTDLQKRVSEVMALRENGQPTIPTNMGLELDTNPFLRASDSNIRSNLGMANATDAEVFAEIRTRKDNA